MKTLFIIALVAIVLVAGCTESTNNNTPPPSTQGKEFFVDIATGFNPQSITIKAGDTVTWTNRDTQNHRVASNPHPVHTDLPGFDSASAIAPGSTYSYTFTRAGSWGYHDHLNPSLTGTVVVE